MHAALAFCLVALLAASAPARATSPPPPDEKWMAHCAKNLASEGLGDTFVRRYCLCMGGIGEIKEMLTWSQTELERSYPPAHIMCHEQAVKR